MIAAIITSNHKPTALPSGPSQPPPPTSQQTIPLQTSSTTDPKHQRGTCTTYDDFYDVWKARLIIQKPPTTHLQSIHSLNPLLPTTNNNTRPSIHSSILLNIWLLWRNKAFGLFLPPNNNNNEQDTSVRNHGFKVRVTRNDEITSIRDMSHTTIG